ncbi:MAG: hypothetical protein AAFV98_10075 [Chloroflexota bacterium]
MTQRQGSRGCFRAFSTIWMVIFATVLLSLTTFNVVFSNILGETCGFIHPFIFEVQASFVDDEGLALTNVGAIPVSGNSDVQMMIEDGSLQSAVANELDTTLRIYDESGTVLLAINDDRDRGGSLTSLVNGFSVETDQTIIIEVATFVDGIEGRYELLVETTGDADTVTAGEDVPEIYEGAIITGGTLSVGSTFEGEIRRDERVQYRLPVNAGVFYRIDLDGVEGFVDVERTASTWSACLQYYGFVSDGGFVINRNGFNWFLTGTVANEALEACDTSERTFRDTLEQCVQSSVRLSATGRIFFFVMLAILVVSLPIFIVDIIEAYGEIVWYIFLMLVVVQATTTAMLFLHLGAVSGIDALSEFGYSIFGGITVGAALVFIDRVASRTRDYVE